MSAGERTVLVETLLTVGVGLLVVVVIFAQYGLLTKMADKRKKQRDTRG